MLRRVLRNLIYMISEGIDNLRANRWLSAFSTVSIGVSVFLFGFFFYIGHNVARIFEEWGRDVRVRVFLAEGLAPAGEQLVGEALRKDPRVAAVTYVSPEEALKSLAKFAPDLYGTAQSFEDNPMPASFDVLMKADASTPAEVAAFATALPRIEGVAEVLYDQEWLEKLRGYTRAASLLGGLLGGALLLAALVAISNVIRISQLNRADEISIMRLVGATNAMIRGPFIVEAGILGALGGSGAVLLLSAVHLFLGHLQETGQAPLLAVLASEFLPVKACVGLVLFASFVGVVGGALSFGKSWKK